jgi:flagellar protein FliO/FliZ
MSKLKSYCSLVTAALLLAQSAVAEEVPLFAAPSTGHASGPSGGGSIGQVTLALGVVLAFVFVAAWAMRHLRKLNFSGRAQHLQVVSQVTLGAKERAVLIRVNDLHVLVGVAPGQVTALHTFTAPIEMTGTASSSTAEQNASTVATTGVMPTFQSLLKKSLGLSR